MADQASGGALSPFLQRRRIAQAVPLLRGRILDYGCGNGALFGELTPAQRDHYVGFDPDAETIAAARARFPSARFIDRTEELGAAFDSVASLAVIEHVPSVPDYLATLHRLLADGGEAVLTSPRESIACTEWGRSRACSAARPTKNTTSTSASGPSPGTARPSASS
jgi:2-polyprenyl-3-methyl-5-hydroxy-6-metoxy-1,4-benzoquinol methylase